MVRKTRKTASPGSSHNGSLANKRPTPQRLQTSTRERMRPKLGIVLSWRHRAADGCDRGDERSAWIAGGWLACCPENETE